MRWRDRLIGIALGTALGVGVVTAFVFLYSDQTVDAPSLSQGGGAGSGAAGEPNSPPVATVRVVGGAPPPSGPAELQYRRGDLVRLRVLSDAPVALELLGYGITRTAAAGEPTPFRFRASKRGTFALVAAGSHIAVAQLRVGPGPP